jgi:hypothetical protein
MGNLIDLCVHPLTGGDADGDTKIILRVDYTPIVDSSGALVSGLKCGDQLTILSTRRVSGLDPLGWRYREDVRPYWPEDYRFQVPRMSLLATVISREQRETQCVLQMPAPVGERTMTNARLHMEDAEAAASYAKQFNTQMFQGMGMNVDMGMPGEAPPSLKICAPVACEVLQSSSPEHFARGQACMLTPYKYKEVHKFVFMGADDFLEVPQAFFHYAAHISGGKEFVCDIQGCEDDQGEIQILDPVILRAETPKIQQYISSYMATQAGKTLPPPAIGDKGPTDERFDRLHPKCGQLCQSFDPMRRGAKGKKGMCGVSCMS